MLTTLIASRGHHTNSFRAQALSVALHAVLITGAVLATQRAAAVIEHIVPEPVQYVRTVPDVTPRPTPHSIDVTRFKGFQVVTSPVVIPDVLPPIDLTKPLTDAANYTGTGVPGGRADGIVPTTDPGAPLTIDEVDVPVRLVPGSGRPAYPDALRSAGLAGEVNVQFVVDTTGRADLKNITVISSTHPRFTEAVM
ncbi:MAG TPA: energy transducer TonB, partial [Gemmatimonadaceae bacterium]